MLRRSHLRPFGFAAIAALLVLPGRSQQAPAAVAVHGRLEQHGGLRLLRTWGTAAERGYAHGLLLGEDIAAAMRSEFAARFGRRQPLLAMVRKALPRLIEYPEPVQAELDALFLGLIASGASRTIEALDRAFDRDDLLVANALDVFGLMGCSGFTVAGAAVEGGGVLSGRNFDWPFTGSHLLQQTLVLVQHEDEGAVATVTWPGYVGAVTGINRDGVAAFLHVGTGQITMTPEPSSWPTAIAAREILRRSTGQPAEQVFALAQELLGYTSPPAGYLTRIVLPVPPAHGSPAGLFETDSHKCLRATVDGPCIVTNHFLGRHDGRDASGDSLERAKLVQAGVDGCLHDGDHQVSIAEGWQMLAAVQRGGGAKFGTLHSLVFRAEPWCFELRLAEVQEGKLVAAPQSSRRFALAREVLFPADPTVAPAAVR